MKLFLMIVFVFSLPISVVEAGRLVTEKDVFQQYSLKENMDSVARITGSQPVIVPMFNRGGQVVSILQHDNFQFVFADDRLLLIEARTEEKIPDFKSSPVGLDANRFIVMKSRFQNHPYASIELTRPGICGMLGGRDAWRTLIEVYQDSHVIYRMADRNAVEKFCEAEVSILEGYKSQEN